MTTAYLAAEDFEAELDEELRLAGVVVGQRHGRLLLSESPPVHAAWAANTWWDAERIEVRSIGDAARQLRARQRNWARYAPTLRGRAELIADKLPHVAARPLELGEVAPDAPLGSWTLLERDVVLAATDCSVPFPNGVPQFVEDRQGPPSRAYLKLWETFARLRRQPRPGERCLDLGAAPGGWTWLLARTGAEVVALDKAPLAADVAALPNVSWEQGSAFALDPATFGPVDWWCSDLIAYPDRLLELVTRWLDTGLVRNLVCTVKFQGATDHAVAARFAALPDAQLFHLDQNKHELTCAILDAGGARR
ncbi:SAM-dependent methyltransferase [Egicoccus halophilus]|uniref:Methyltransferase n=1 Tax=Egicoccus halophilus TaxID=1670830 RepID=A0A8J3AGA4_9ACTN|nr:SAM-dependent methyltransferase [Egicoccus halophilus]GGI08705.1 methyltransferase [Egicoccus halophilus]